MQSLQPSEERQLDPPLCKVAFQLDQVDGYPPVAIETVWARSTESEHEFVLDNLPFFALGATLGDRVKTRQEGDARWFVSVVTPSANSLARIVLFDGVDQNKIRDHLASLGCSSEFIATYGMLAVNVPSSSNMQKVEEYLLAAADAGQIDYEVAILRH